MTHGSLFTGIGGFDLGFEWAGIRTVFQVEIDEYCRRLLELRFPEARRYADIRAVRRSELQPVDIISGGFPCQDISEAGQRRGIDGNRSGLWSEYFRIVGELRPRFVVVENVPALLVRGIDRVVGNLASIGYDAEWRVVGCDDLCGSQHRKRIWILAYPDNAGFQGPIWAGKQIETREIWKAPYSEPLRSTCGFWPPGPRSIHDIPRMDDGPANRLDRLRGLGNAVVPQIACLIGRLIMECESCQR